MRRGVRHGPELRVLRVPVSASWVATEADLERAAVLLSKCHDAVVFTGAGVSAESGIPTFRDPGGIWERFPPEEYATIDAFLTDPKKVWPFLLELADVVRAARPNPAHHAIADLERLGVVSCVVTQNVDGLHQRAGSQCVLELHGTGEFCVCVRCRKRFDSVLVPRVPLPPRCTCGGVLKPDVVMFGEGLPEGVLREAQTRVSRCDALIVVGTSASVYPAAALPALARSAGAAVIEVNPEPAVRAGQADVRLAVRAGDVMPRLVDRLRA